MHEESAPRPSLGYRLAALVVALSLVATTAGAGQAPTLSQIVATRYSSLGSLSLPGIDISNFGVIDGRIFRGGQPDRLDYGALKSLGITVVIDLRDDAEKSSRAHAEASGLKYINIGLNGTKTPTDQQAAAFIKAVDEAGDGLVYVHCAAGKHRTGSMIAVYRVARDGWTADRAYQEMKKFGFYSLFGHGGHKDYVYDYYSRMTANPSSVPVAYVAAATEKDPAGR